MKPLNPTSFLRTEGITLDVRSPSEYAHAHLPKAVNIPLFSDQERAEVGTCYKQQGAGPAFQLGLRFAGPKLENFFVKARKQLENGALAKIHCWRGGMRSQAMAQLFAASGIPSVVLEGGYKAYRHHVLKELETPLTIRLLGGMTGSGKTLMLQALRERGEQILDLEALANHRGSSYGKQSGPQPSTEQFENLIADQIRSIDTKRPIWIEDESRLIGCCKIPDPLFHQMKRAKLIVVERPLEERMEILRQQYAETDPAELINSTHNIANRLGSERAGQVTRLIREKGYRKACELVLSYYDKSYQHATQQRDGKPLVLFRTGLNTTEWTDALLATV